MNDAKDGITKIVEKISKGLIEDDEAAVLLAGLREERNKFQAILDSVEEPANVIELQPKALLRFRASIESLAKILRSSDGNVPIELGETFRQLVAAVVVEPTHAGEAYSVSLKAYLSSLMHSELSVIKLVAGVRSVNYRRHDEELFSLGTWRIEMLRAMKKYVAGEKVRSAHNRRDEDEIISFGTWRIEMVKTTKSYIQREKHHLRMDATPIATLTKSSQTNKKK